jgi:hypothetical protein
MNTEDAAYIKAIEEQNNKLRAEVTRLEIVCRDLRSAAKAYLDTATYPDWAAGDCRRCEYDLYSSTHAPDCPYARAETALLVLVGEAVDGR